jgi:hypothetical protein
MYSTTPSVPSRKVPLLLGALLLLALTLNHYFQAPPRLPQPYVYAAAGGGGAAFAHEVITEDITVDWTSGGDFDPRGKCPQDFLGSGFTVVYKKLADGAYFRYLYHKGKKILYRIDKDVIGGKARIGLHWVTGTAFNARYRIADAAYKGGKTVQVPTAKGTRVPATFQYGQAVSKKRVQPGRELFRETHIQPRQCREWWDIFNFLP